MFGGGLPSFINRLDIFHNGHCYFTVMVIVVFSTVPAQQLVPSYPRKNRRVFVDNVVESEFCLS